ncbi:MAG: NifB/NifX family molybdenum-iron cluster-binding protein [Bacillota bacterium]|nr:NifB/NifX family molybdenum-iron cluster-binding protein [Bacillota bacterium]
MRIAVASEGGMVARHFGRCPEYTIFEVRDGTVTGRTVVPNPGHQPGFLPVYLGDMGVSCIIAGGMGPRAQGLFEQQGCQQQGDTQQAMPFPSNTCSRRMKE